jgi:hypothetical protein
MYSLTHEAIAEQTCLKLKVTTSYRFLVIQKWPQHTVIIFDIFHATYDISTAHYKEDILVLRIIINQRFDIRLPSANFRESINTQVAMFHNVNG